MKMPMGLNNKQRLATIHSHSQDKLDLVKFNLIYCHLKQIWVVRNKDKLKQDFFPLSLHRVHCTPSLLSPLSPTEQCRREGMQVLHSVPLLLLPPHTFPCSLVRPPQATAPVRRNCFSVRSPPWAAAWISTIVVCDSMGCRQIPLQCLELLLLLFL